MTEQAQAAGQGAKAWAMAAKLMAVGPTGTPKAGDAHRGHEQSRGQVVFGLTLKPTGGLRCRGG